MSKKDMTEGQLLYHAPCISCPSSDAMAVYEKEIDGEIVHDATCFSCNTYFNSEQVEEHGVKKIEGVRKKVNEVVDFSDIEQIDFRGWKSRNITRITSRKYGVRTEVDSEAEAISRYYPSTVDGKIVGYKKRITSDKNFIGIGSTKATNEFFGQSVFEAGQKYLVITTGEEDAMAFAQALYSEQVDKDKNKVEYWTPCISVTCGDGSIIKQFKANFEYINSFEKVVLAYDDDESIVFRVTSGEHLGKLQSKYAGWYDENLPMFRPLKKEFSIQEKLLEKWKKQGIDFAYDTEQSSYWLKHVFAFIENNYELREKNDEN